MAVRLAPLVAAFAPIAAVLSGCWSMPVTPEIAIHELPSRNPTSWVFDAPLPEVRAAIREKLRFFGRPEETIFAYGFHLHLSDREDPWSQPVLREPGNEQDFVLGNIGDPFGVTETVRGDGRPLDIQGWYHLHLRSIGPERTSVTVTAHDVKVIVGMTSGFRPHGPAHVYLPIEGTTIEEYLMLLEIGEALGTEGMPPLIRPE